MKHIVLFTLAVVFLFSCKTAMVTKRGSMTIYKGKIETIEIKENDHNKGIIRGKFVDIRTAEIIPFGNVGVVGTKIGTMSNEKGEFEIVTTGDVTIEFSSVGHTTMLKKFTVLAGQELELSIQLGTTIQY